MFYAWVVFLGFCLLLPCTLVFWFALAYDLFCSLFWLGFGYGLTLLVFCCKPCSYCVWLGLLYIFFALLLGYLVWFGCFCFGCIVWGFGGLIVVLRLFKGVLGAG